MTRIFNKREVKEKRRSLRKEMPPAEVMLWTKLRGKNLNNVKFRRQYSIGPYIVDFYSPQMRLAVEIDGESHFIDGADIRDRDRQAFIESPGIYVLRFTNRDIYERLDGVIVKIAERLKLLTSPSPSL